MAVIDKIVSRCNVACSAVLVLTGHLDSKVIIVQDVLFDQDSGAAIHVNAIGVLLVLVCRIAPRVDVVNQIAADHSVASLVDGRVGCGALETDDVDSDVVVVMDNIVRNAEVRDVPVHHQRLARTGFEVMHFIAVNNQVSDRSLGVGSVHGNAKPIGAMSRTITSLKSLLNMMDLVLQQFDMEAGTHDAYAQWHELMFGGVEVAYLKTLDSHVTLIVNRDYRLASRRREKRCIKNGRFARIASKRNESIRRVA